jgi:hypothetical protein
MKTPQEMTKKDIATILAARQLGDTIYDHPENIRKNTISAAELRTEASRGSAYPPDGRRNTKENWMSPG